MLIIQAVFPGAQSCLAKSGGRAARLTRAPSTYCELPLAIRCHAAGGSGWLSAYS